MKGEKSVSLFFILGWVLIVSGPLYTGYFLFKKIEKDRLLDSKYNIEIIEQRSIKQLPTLFFSELFGLSKDKPLNLFLFDTKKAETLIMAHPLFSKAEVTKQKPNRIVIAFELRKPYFRLADFENALMDEEGVVFPDTFFEKDDLPIINLGLSSAEEHKLKVDEKDLAFALHKFFGRLGSDLNVKRIDVSNAYCKSLGRREIDLVITCEHLVEGKDKKVKAIFPVVARFSTKNYERQLGNFLELLDKMEKDYAKQLLAMDLSQDVQFKPKVIDMRIPKIAFID